MKNKKRLPEMAIATIISLLILVCIGIVWTLVDFVQDSQESKFKITKEECRNESFDNGNKNVKTYNITHKQLITNHQADTTMLCEHVQRDGPCHRFYENVVLTPIRLYEEWDCSEYRVWWEGDIKKEERSERICQRNLSLDSIEIRHDLAYQKEQRNFSVYLEFISTEYFYDVIYEEKEVCEQVEVEEIITNMPTTIYLSESKCGKFVDSIGEISAIGGWFKGEKLNKIYGFNLVEEKDYCFELIKISKQDLSVKWLEENCEMEWREEDIHCYERSTGKTVPCGRNPSYICEEYLVEVLI